VCAVNQIEKEEKNKQKRFDIEIVGGENDLKQHLLINCDELLVPFVDISSAFAGLVLIGIRLWCGQRLATVMFAIFKDLLRTR
jgi:hypothetical protein